METKRHVASVLTLSAFVAFALASGGNKSSATGGDSAAASASAAKPKKAPTPADVDTAALTTELACAGKKTDVCRVLADFGAATDAPAVPASGKVVYFGASWGSNGGDPKSDPKRDYEVVRFEAGAAAAPADIADSDVLAATGTARPFHPESYAESDAVSLLASLKAGKKPEAGNTVIDSAKSGYFGTMGGGVFGGVGTSLSAVVKTSGASIAFINTDGKATWMRKKDTRVLVVEYDKGATVAHDKVAAKAWVSEVWGLP